MIARRQKTIDGSDKTQMHASMVTNQYTIKTPMIDKCYWRQRGERVQTSRKLMLSPTTISEYYLQCRKAQLSIIQARFKSSEI